jgi:hypothetical protein
MRSTIEIADELYEQAAAAAARRGMTLESLVEEGLRRVLQGLPPNAVGGRKAFPLIHSTEPGTLSPDDVMRIEDEMAEEDWKNGRLS